MTTMLAFGLTGQQLKEEFEKAGKLGISLNLVADKIGIEDINEFLTDNYHLFKIYRKAQALSIEEINDTLYERAKAGDVKAIDALKKHTNLYNFIEEEDLENYRPKNNQAINEIYKRAMQRLKDDKEEKKNSVD
jgi:hypothetical protein